MKKLIAALALVAGASAVPALASNVAVSISVGEPGFYGHLDVGGYGRPAVIYREPVVVAHRYRGVPAVYMRVPADHSRNWNRYCGRYDACSRPVYFVRDEWYRDVYTPRYRQVHGRNWHDNGRGRDHARWDNGRRGNDHWGHDGRGRDWYDRHDGRRDDHRGDRNGHDRHDGGRDGRNDGRGGRGNDHNDHGRDGSRDGGHDGNRGGDRGGRRS